MHLFTAAFGLTPDLRDRLQAELARTARLFPQLDHDGQWGRDLDGGVFVGGVASRAAMARPRAYVHATDDEIVLFDGLPIDSSGAIAAHDASALAEHWDGLEAALEGRFAIIRVRAAGGPHIELLTDPLGVEQVYVAERAGMSILSNSAGLVARALGDSGWDSLGVSTFLVLDWVAGDRTLRPSVHTVPGAQHWTWTAGQRGWTKRRYWHYADADPPASLVDDAFVAEVGGGIGRFCARAAEINGTINAPLTGGKDSRMLAAILMAAGVPARYWTKGVSESSDVQIALALADHYGLPHRLSGRPTQDPAVTPPPVSDDWPSLSDQFVRQNDGLASLFLIGNIHGQPASVDRLAVTLSAMCAESARRANAQLYLDAPGASLARTVRYLPYDWADRPRGLVSADAHRIARRHVATTLERLADEGVALSNLSTVFYLEERCRRWAANNPRELAQTEDKVLPFMTRTFVMPVLATHPHERATHQIHRRITSGLVPGMGDDVPLAQGWFTSVSDPPRREMMTRGVMSRLPLSVQRAQLALRERLRPAKVEWEPWTPYDELSWLEANLGWAREIALSSPSSPMWDYVDRRRFEHLLDPATESRERRVNQLPLFAGLTMLAYDGFERELRSS